MTIPIKNRRFTCIVCPMGCEIDVDFSDDEIISIQGNQCVKGENYVKSELTNPQRTIASSVFVKNGEIPLVSVRTSGAIPKNKIFDCMKEIQKLEIEAPVKLGDILISNVLNLGVDIIATKNIAAQKQ